MKKKVLLWTAVAFSAAHCLVLTPEARADVHILIEEISPDVVITATGSLVLPGMPMGQAACGNGQVNPPPTNGAIQASTASICVGTSTAVVNVYPVTGLTSFGTGSAITLANQSSGSFFGVEGNLGLVGADYASGAPIQSSSVFKNQSLSSLGINQTGILGNWLLGNQTITLKAVPGPLSLLGLPISYGWTRRLRRRIRSAGS